MGQLSRTLTILTVEVLAVLAFEFVALPGLAGSKGIGFEIPPAFKTYYASYIDRITKLPLETKIATSAVGCLLGNVISQLPRLPKFNLLEAIRFTLFGALLHGPICHYWYGFIETVFYPQAPSSAEAILAKTVFDQIVFAPVFNSIFFVFMEFARLSPGTAFSKVWPMAHLISFRYIPVAARVLFLNAVQVGYNVLLSSLASSSSSGKGGGAGRPGRPKKAVKAH